MINDNIIPGNDDDVIFPGNDTYPNSIKVKDYKEIYEEARKMILFFVEKQFGKELADEVDTTVMRNIRLRVVTDPTLQDKLAGCCHNNLDGTCIVALAEIAFRKYQNQLGLLETLIHEIAHAISELISKGPLNMAIEEGLVNLFAEATIKTYIKEGHRIDYISEEENNKLISNYKEYEPDSYYTEGQIVKSILYALRKKGKDIDAIREYFFGSKDKFVEICEEEIDPRLRAYLTVDLEDSQTGEHETPDVISRLYQDVNTFKNILVDFPFDQMPSENDENADELYKAHGLLIYDILLEREIKYKWLTRPDKSSLDLEDIHELTSLSNGIIAQCCSRYGCSDLIKKIIIDWYQKNKNNLSNFEEILPLVGAIPFEIFKKIIAEEKIIYPNEILRLIHKYHVLNDPNNYVDESTLLNQCLEINNISLSEQNMPVDSSFFANLSDEKKRVILNIYNKNYYNIELEDYIDVIEILKDFDPQLLQSETAFKFFMSEIRNSINSKNLDKELYILIKIQQLPKEFIDFFSQTINLNDQQLCGKVSEAIDTLKENGYEITNKDEILDCIKRKDYKSIRIIPDIDAEKLKAFEVDRNTTSVLVDTCIFQFLEGKDLQEFDAVDLVSCLKFMNRDTLKYEEISSVIQQKLFRNKDIHFSRVSISELLFLSRIKLNEKQIDDIVKFFKSAYPDQKEDRQEFDCKYDANNINRLLDLFANVDLSHDGDARFFCRKIMRAFYTIPKSEIDMNLLREIYYKMINLKINLDKECITHEFFGDDEELKNLVLNGQKAELPQNVYAEKCPADAIREHIEKIIEMGKEIPKEIIISPKNIEYLMNSQLVDFIGAGPTGNELQFYWKATENLPALEVKVTRREDGKFVLTYMKEEASKDKPEFLWQIDDVPENNGQVVISRTTDALEDLIDMDI